MQRRAVSILTVFAVFYMTVWCCCAASAQVIGNESSCCDHQAASSVPSVSRGMGVTSTCTVCPMFEFRQQIVVEKTHPKLQIDLPPVVLQWTSPAALIERIQSSPALSQAFALQTPLDMRTCMLC